MKLFLPAWVLATAAVVNAQTTSPPSEQPSSSAAPSLSPVVTDAPTSVNTTESAPPSGVPTPGPTLSLQPSGDPTASATLSLAPSGEPTGAPTSSSQPSATASDSPSSLPTVSSQPSVTASDAPTSLPTRTFQPTDEPTSQPSVSSQPSAVSSGMPSHIPTKDPMVDMGPPYDACPICADGEVIGNPTFALLDGQTCATTNAAGLAGDIPPDLCTLLQQNGTTACACAPMMAADTAAPTATPTASPVAAFGIAPSTGECSTSSCTLVPVWDQLQAFVDAASDGDSLCMCGRFYEEATCGTAEITIVEAKEVTLECAPAQICSLKCPQSAFVVNAGTLTLKGTEQNFMMSGGTTSSRIIVGAEGALVANQIVFENTKNTAVPETADTRRHLQVKGSRGGAIQTYGATTVTETKFENCTATLEGGAVYIGSGAASFLASTFAGNRAFEGAAIFADGGELTVQDSVFSDNVATATNGNPDIFARSGVQLDACGNTGESDVLGDDCSAAFDARSLVWTALAGMSLLAAWCM
mmetsp:Transcript_3730/g.7124  ORF Transcript_3730/g.7124 Transcript_3730/m.7124 type:complete len:527 (+) Transcript_3730:102-1682(+)